MFPYRKIWHGIQSGALLFAITALSSFLLYRLILGFLTQETAGIWFLLVNIGTFIAFFDLGIGPTLSRELSFTLGDSGLEPDARTAQIGQWVVTTQRIFLVLASSLFIIALPSGIIFLNYIAKFHHPQINIAWTLFMMGASLNLVASGWNASLYGIGLVAQERLTRSISLLIGLLFSIIFLYCGFGIVGLASASLIQAIFAITISRSILHSHIPRPSKKTGPSLLLAKKLIRPSLQWTLMSIGGLLALQTDNVIIAVTLGPAAIPSYAALAKLTTVLMTLSLLIPNSSVPFLSRRFAEGEHVAFRDLMLRNVRYSLGVLAILASFIGVFSDQIIAHWIGKETFAGFSISSIFLLIVFLEAHHVSLATATMAAGHLVFGWSALGGGILSVIFSLVLVKYYGLIGVALGTLLAQVLTNNWYVPFKSLKKFQIPIKIYFKKIFLAPVVVAISLLIIDLILRINLGGLPGLSFVLTSLVFSIISGAILFYFVILKEPEQIVLRQLLLNWMLYAGKDYLKVFKRAEKS